MRSGFVADLIQFEAESSLLPADLEKIRDQLPAIRVGGVFWKLSRFGASCDIPSSDGFAARQAIGQRLGVRNVVIRW